MSTRTILARFWIAAFWSAFGVVVMVLNVFNGTWWGCLLGLGVAASSWFAARITWRQLSLNRQQSIRSSARRYVYYLGGPTWMNSSRRKK